MDIFVIGTGYVIFERFEIYNNDCKNNYCYHLNSIGAI